MEKYLYCVIDSEKAIQFAHHGIGNPKASVQVLAFRDLGMVFSDIGEEKIIPETEYFLEHQLVQEDAMRNHTILPLQFGTITPSEADILNILETQYDTFKAHLERLRGKKEVGIKALWHKDIVYPEIIEEYQDIKELRAQLLNLPPEETHYQRMEIGKMVEAALEEKRTREAQALLAYLTPFCQEHKINSPISERMVLNGAFLLDNHQEAVFDQKVNELAAQHEARIKFKYVGPVPPYNFVSINIALPEASMAD